MAFEFRYYWNSITDHVSFFIDADNSVLEIGCRTGHLIGSLNCMDKTGIDSDPDMINKARKKFPSVNFIVSDSTEFSSDRKFDVIIVSNSIGRVGDVQRLFRNVSAASHPSTRIIVTYYNFFWEPLLKFGEFIGVKKKLPDQNWLSRKDIKNLLTLSGFETYRLSSSTLLPVYIPLVSEVCNSFLAHLPLLKNLCINNYAYAKPAPVVHPISENLYTVSVIVPARNESGNVEQLLQRLPVMGKNTEVIFIEGGSDDETWKAIRSAADHYSGPLKIKIDRQNGTGKNDAVRKGFSLSEGEILMILDADMTVAPEDLPRFYQVIVSGQADFVNGCRLVYPMKKEAMRLLNLFGNKVFGLIFSWLLEQPIKDTLCGTKVMWKKDYMKLDKNRSYFGEFDPFGDFDLLFGAYKLNLKIVDLPIQYHERTYGRSNISRIRHGWLLFKMCLTGAMKIKFR
jgi:hypothetical protein